MTATAIQNKSVLEPSMRAVIVYDDFGFAAAANAMLVSVARRIDEAAHWKVMPWRVDMLRSSAAAKAALAEAIDAHLLVLALRPAQALPVGLRDWLETWAVRREVQEAALAVVGGGKDHRILALGTSDLCQFARRHGLSFVFDDGDLAGDESAVLTRDFHDRAVPVNPTIQDILHQEVHSDYPRWGINE